VDVTLATGRGKNERANEAKGKRQDRRLVVLESVVNDEVESRKRASVDGMRRMKMSKRNKGSEMEADRW
jgi:hypothetical protein